MVPPGPLPPAEAPADLGAYLPFVVDGEALGLVAPSFVPVLAAFPSVFSVGRDAVRLDKGLCNAGARSRHVNDAMRLLADQGEIQPWRDEMFPVTSGFDQPTVFEISRSAVSSTWSNTARGASFSTLEASCGAASS